MYQLAGEPGFRFSGFGSRACEGSQSGPLAASVLKRYRSRMNTSFTNSHESMRMSFGVRFPELRVEGSRCAILGVL